MMTDYTEQPGKITCTLCGVPFWTRRPERDTCTPCLAGVEQMEAETKALAFACNDTERTFKGRDAEISSAEDRVVDAAVAWRLVWRDSVIYQHEHRQKLIEAVDALIAARKKASELSPLPDGS